jgi:hypothetical protein
VKNTSDVSLILPYVCLVSIICWAPMEFYGFMYLFNRVSNVSPVCPIYFNGQSLHFNC